MRRAHSRLSIGGAKGIRTPDPHTASVVRYQLRHSPEKLCQPKLHHRQPSFKTAGQAASSSASAARRSSTGRVSDATTQPMATISSTIPLIVKPHP